MMRRPCLRFVGGLAEGTETIAVHVLLFLFPQHATVIVWAFTAVVAITAAQRIVTGLRLLRAPARAGSAASLRRQPAAGASTTVPLPSLTKNQWHNATQE